MEGLYELPLTWVPLLVSAGLAKLCTLTVSGDTGLLHLAAAMGKRAVAIIPSTAPGNMYPFQHPEWALNPRLKCGASIAEPLVVQGLRSREERRRRVQDMLAEVGLDDALTDRFPGELSGGQRQRMAIARALITQPRFVVFDEAVSALDVSVQSQILNLIRRLQAQHGFAAMFISHDLAATRYVSQRIAVMRSGSFVEVAAARKFYDRPDHPYSQALYLTIAGEVGSAA